jgi:membrane protease YdiL (CAAX protease family)
MSFVVSRFAAGIIEIILPIFWVKKKYDLKPEALGLRKGRWPISASFLIGVGAAIIYYASVREGILGFGWLYTAAKIYYADWILLLFSFLDFWSVILAPISEEILFRGFLYGYLRKRLGIYWGLTLQGLLFDFMHFWFLQSNTLFLCLDNFLKGLMLGILYEKTKSVYPSIVCHSAINYIASVFDPI